MQNESSGPQVIRFGTFELDVRGGELRKRGVKIKLQDQPMRILEMLLASPGLLVTREELRSRLWPSDTTIDFDHSLNKAVNKLREALDDSAENPRFVETIPRRGYRMILPVGIAPPLRTSTAAATSVAVARLVVRENDPEVAQHATALTRNLVARLGQVRGYTGQMQVVAFEGDSARDATHLG